MRIFFYINRAFILGLIMLFFNGILKSQANYERKFLRFFNSQSLAGKVNAFDTLNGDAKLKCYPLIKDELAIIREKAIADHQEDVLDKLYKIEGEMYYNNKYYSRAIPIFTDLLAKNKIKSLKDSIHILHILKNAYLNIRSLNKTVEIHRILVTLLKRSPNVSVWVLMPRLSTIYYEMRLYRECLNEQLQEFSELKNNSAMLINFYNNRGIYWEKYGNQDSAIFWFTKAKNQFYKEFPDNKLSVDNEFTIGLIEGNIGQSLMALKQYDNAIPLLKKDVIGSKNIKNYHNASISQLEISKCYLELNKLDLSKKYLDSSNSLLQGIDDYKTKLNIIKQYGVFYDKSGAHQIAINYYKNYISVKDSFDAQNNLRELLSAQVASQVDEKEKLIRENQKNINEKNIEVSRQKSIRNVLLISGFGLILLILLISIQLKKANNRKQLLEIRNKQIETRNEIINKSLLEKDLLVKEVHHRVKNNLQIISSLMKLQSAKSNNEEVRNSLNEAQDRINSMALLHQLLYRNNQMTSLLFNEYLTGLISQISSSFSLTKKQISIESNFIELELDLDTAIPLGLITNELVSNAYKHAFNGNEGLIKIELSKLFKNTYQLKITDNGQGLPANFDLHSNESLGLDIVCILSEQINAELKIYNENGANFDIIFKVL
jgi:two-component sensor histidine kinase